MVIRDSRSVRTFLRRYVSTCSSLCSNAATSLYVYTSLYVLIHVATSPRRYVAISLLRCYVSTYPRAPAPRRPLDRFTNPSYVAMSLLLHVAALPRRCVATPLLAPHDGGRDFGALRPRERPDVEGWSSSANLVFRRYAAPGRVALVRVAWGGSSLREVAAFCGDGGR